MQYTIRPALRQDLPAIVDIYNSTVATRQSTADLSPTTVAEREMWFAAHTDKRPIYALYNADGTVLAWGSFSDYHPRYAYHISAEVSIYVRHDMRGAGVGKILLRHMLERAPSLDIHNVIALVFGHNYPSLNLFHRFGFEEWGRLPQVCDLETMLADVVILGKRIVD